MSSQALLFRRALVLVVSLAAVNLQTTAQAHHRAWHGSATTTSTTSTTVVPRTTTTTAAPTTTTTTVPPSTKFLGDTGRPFADTSFVNAPVPANPVLDPNSPSIAAYLGASGVYRFAQIWDSGVPVWNADASTPRYTIPCTQPWGVCPFDGYTIPIPPNAGTNNNSDKPMVVVDFSTRRAYEFFQFQKDSSGIRTGWGAISDIDAEGIPFTGHAVAAGISRLAGLVRTYEIRQGRIDHALTFLSDNTCANRYRYPAQKTDGDSWDSNCIEQGTRIQLDPSINVDAIPGISQFEKIVAKALQTYGAYVQDKATYHSGSRMTFWFEPPAPGEDDPYVATGVPWDWWHMPNIPWSNIRVLKDWTGGDGLSGNLGQGRPAWASSVESSSLAASSAFDGSTATRWSSTFADPQWIYVDLGSSQSIGRVKLRWEAAYASMYRIEVSQDAVNWSPVFSTTNGDGGLDDVPVSAVGRYVRMYGSSRATTWGYSLWEFEVYRS